MTTCTQCDSPLPADAVAGQCPSCLLEMALGGEEDLPFAATHRTFGGYELGRQIGAGGMGVVYEANRLTDGRKVAVKLIRDFHVASPTALCRFTIEAEAAARLDHPNIVRIHEVGETNGHPFLSMDLVEGESVRTSDLPPKAIAALMAKVARAVQHAHERGVLHRDIKPGNILIDPAGEPHLTDFGLAKILDQGGPLTASGDAPGTPSYMSPEQVQGHEVGCAADIYGLGAVLYTLLTGRPPFQGNTSLETFRLIVEQPVKRPESVDPKLEIICLKCLEKDPRQRYATAEALAADLESFVADRPIQARAPGALYRTSQWVKRNPVGAGLIGSLCLGLAVALVLLNVVNRQRREIQLDRDLAFDEGMQKISQIWRDPATKSVTISARELNILAGRSPVDLRLAPRQLVFGISADDGPSSMAQRYADLLSSFHEALDQQTAIHLRLFKRSNEDGQTLASGEVDLMVLSAVNFLRAPGAMPIAYANTSGEGVIFARTNIRTLAELRGKAIAFPEPDTTAAVWAKARIFAAGLKAKELRQTNSGGTIELVLGGGFDAGVAPRAQFERYRHLGLAALDRFSETPNVLAARADLEPELVQALQRIIRDSKAGPEASFLPAGANAKELEALRFAIQQAELFER